MSSNDQYALNWSNHTNHIKRAFDSLLAGNEFVDVTLSCEGKKISAHKMLLSACSSYFHDLFRENPCQHPIVILKDVKFQNLMDILKFMYHGEVSVDIENFDSFLKTAELLQVSGLTEDDNKNGENVKKTNTKEAPAPDIHLPEVSLATKSQKSNVDNVKSESTKKRQQDAFVNENENLIVKKRRDTQMPNTNQEGDRHSISVKQEMEAGNIQYEDEPFDETLGLSVTNDELENMNSIAANETVEPQKFLDAPECLPVNKEETIVSDSSLNPPTQCPICFKTFSHPLSLRQHMPVHKGTTKCPICHIVLSRKYHLKVHMRARHNEVF